MSDTQNTSPAPETQPETGSELVISQHPLNVGMEACTELSLLRPGTLLDVHYIDGHPMIRTIESVSPDTPRVTRRVYRVAFGQEIPQEVAEAADLMHIPARSGGAHFFGVSAE